MNEELARRAVACPRWRWMPGMLAWCPSPAAREEYDWTAEDWGLARWTGRRFVRLAVEQPGHVRMDGTVAAGDPAVWIEGAWFPDLDDAATKGCLLALAREAWKDPGIYVAPTLNGQIQIEGWEVCSFAPHLPDVLCEGLTEEAALVAALERAP